MRGWPVANNTAPTTFHCPLCRRYARGSRLRSEATYWTWVFLITLFLTVLVGVMYI